LTIQVRLLVCSIDKAEQIGLNWWRHDPRLTASGAGASLPAAELESRLDRIEQRLAELASGESSAPARRGGTRRGGSSSSSPGTSPKE
jgi:hypothetical protein